MDNTQNIVLPVKQLVQAPGRRGYARHNGQCCSRCHRPKGLNQDGTPRTDRYCAECRSAYSRAWRVTGISGAGSRADFLAKVHAALAHCDGLTAINGTSKGTNT